MERRQGISQNQEWFLLWTVRRAFIRACFVVLFRFDWRQRKVPENKSFEEAVHTYFPRLASSTFSRKWCFLQIVIDWILIWFTFLLNTVELYRIVLGLIQYMNWCLKFVHKLFCPDVTSPGYNRTGWMGVKHQVTYLLTCYDLPGWWGVKQTIAFLEWKCVCVIQKLIVWKYVC